MGKSSGWWWAIKIGSCVSDRYVGLVFTKFDEIVDYIKSHSVVTTSDTEIGRR